MSRGDSFDTFSGLAITHGDGSGRYRAIRVDRTAFASAHPQAVGVGLGNGAALEVGADEVKLAELLSRPETVELQVFLVQIEDEDDLIALADRAETVNYPPQYAALRVTDWGDSHGADARAALEEIPFEDDSAEAKHDDSLRRTAADREQSGRHARHPARRQRTGSQGGWVG